MYNKCRIKWWNVSIPNDFGAVTCGDSFENAVHMAQDTLEQIYEMAPKSFKLSTSIEETKNNFPGEIVVPIEIELDKVESTLIEFTKEIKEGISVRLDGKKYLISDDLYNYRTSRILVLDKNGKRTAEIINFEKKFNLLHCALGAFESLGKSKSSKFIYA